MWVRDAREDLWEAISTGIRRAGVIPDPEYRIDCADEIMRALMETARDEIGWFILGDLGHVYRVEHSRMIDAEPLNHSVWEVQTRNDL